MAVVDPDSVEVVDFATVQDNAQKKGMIVSKSAGGPPYKLIQGQETILISESLVEIQAELEGNTIAKIGDVFYDDNVGPMIMEAAGSFPLQESDMPGAAALNQYLYTATSGYNEGIWDQNTFDDLVQQWTRRERMTEPTSPDPYAYTPTGEQYTMKLITEGKMDEALAFNNMMREFTEERMTEEEMSQRAASLARTPTEYRAWMDAMLGGRQPEDIGQRRTIADQQRTYNEMGFEGDIGEGTNIDAITTKDELGRSTGILKDELRTEANLDQISPEMIKIMDRYYPGWREKREAELNERAARLLKLSTVGMIGSGGDYEGEGGGAGAGQGILPTYAGQRYGVNNVTTKGLAPSWGDILASNAEKAKEAEKSAPQTTVTSSLAGDPVLVEGAGAMPTSRGPIFEEEYGDSGGYEFAMDERDALARRAEILGRTGALMKHTGKTGKIGMSRFRTTPEERAFIESTGGIEAYGEAVPSYSGRVEYVPTTDTYLLDEGDQVIPTPEKTKQKPIKSLQQGTNYVGQSGPYGLHAGEIVQKQLNPYEDYGTDIFSSDYYRRRKNQEGSWGINQRPSSEDLLFGQGRQRLEVDAPRPPGYDPYEDFGGGETVPMHTRQPSVTKSKLERDAPGYIPMGPTLEGGGQLFQGSMWKPYDYQYNRKTGEMTKVGGTQGRLNELISTGIFGAGSLMRKKALALAADFDEAQTAAAAEGQKRFKKGGKGARMYG